MCLLTFMPDTVTASYDDLLVGADNNPDGFGFAIHDRTKIVTGHGMNFDKVVNEFMKLRKTMTGPALFHSRITTHGDTNKANCHPFQIGRDRLSVLAHNGMLPIKAHGGRSDTRIFAEDVLPSRGGVQILDSKRVRDELSQFAKGSKLVVLTANPITKEDWYIINETDGHWSEDGVWWSNTSYKWSRYTHIGSGMYSTGWSQSTYVPRADDPYYDSRWDDWCEEWQCDHCGMITTVDEKNVNDVTEVCQFCHTCWYCNCGPTDCSCFTYDDEPRDLEYVPYDSLIDIHND